MGLWVMGECFIGSILSDFLFYFYLCCVYSLFNFIFFKLLFFKLMMIYISLVLMVIRGFFFIKVVLVDYVWNIIVWNGIFKVEFIRCGIRVGCYYI